MLIIHVDDDVEDREMFLAAVESIKLPITCLQFDNCIKLIHFLDHSDEWPEFLFIDINMPKMSGLECIEHIKETHVKAIKTIMHSTSFNPSQEKKFKNMGIQCLLKTSHFSELVQSIKTILSAGPKV